MPIRKSIRNNIYWKSKHAPKTLGEAMRKVEELYMKHIYATGDIPNRRESTMSTEVTINEIDGSERPGDYSHRCWRNRETSKISPNQDKPQGQPWKTRGNSEILPGGVVFKREMETYKTRTTDNFQEVHTHK